MEVCGGHTHSIYKYGVDDLLPANVELVHGPAARCASSRWAASTTASRWRTSRA
jgi:hydrogenase expression/formation protein HypD